ncbi:hypothetical protein ABZZ37_16075 [Streptomyces sp. NPDC006464]|uniref:hypothetical protein n=1 Tax=Streptomyces sp. NPDC006464 TaxID=3154305 RepID=UPI0033B19218
MNAKKWFTLTAAGLVLSGAATAGALATNAQAVDPGITVVKSSTSTAGETVIATCPSGSKVIGGGYQGAAVFNNPGTVSSATADLVEANTPTSDGTGWVARFAEGRVIATAICETGASTQVVKSGASKAGETAIATCPSGSKVIGGGYQGAAVFSNPGTVSERIDDIVEANTPTMAGTGWGARFANGRVIATAICSA